jgi:transcriptional regulator with PAS, ATPase and Fis domain
MRSRFSEEKLMDVVQSGMAMSLHKGRYVTGVRSAGCDAVCVPLRRRGSTFGALCVESAAELTELVLQLVSATADALALARGIWQGGPDAASRSRDDMADMPVIVGCSKPLQEVFRMAKRYAQVDSTVLIRGATGTGKELFAKMIHSASDRTGQPFVAVNCGAIAPNLVESELFGHEKGAFTGAVGCRKGKFEAAESGTLFLDEVGELPADVQVKLLRVIEERVVTRVGGNATIPVEARIIAATHRDLESAVQTGSFRDDLYHRLRVLELRVPALKDRPEDVPELVKHFIKDLRSRMNTKVQEVAPDAMDVLKAYSWPGNVRELRNVIERSLVLAEGDTLTKDDLAAELVVACSDAKLPSALTSPASGTDLQCVEREHIERVLRECGGNKRVASQRLGISRSTLYEKIRLWHEK